MAAQFLQEFLLDRVGSEKQKSQEREDWSLLGVESVISFNDFKSRCCNAKREPERCKKMPEHARAVIL